MKTYIIVIIFLLSIFNVSVPAYAVEENNALKADEPVPHNFSWVVLGLVGLGYLLCPEEYNDIQDFGGLTGYLGYSYNHSTLPWFLLTARGSFIFIPSLYGSSGFTVAQDCGILAGVVGKTKRFHLSLSAGISITGGDVYIQ